MLERQETRRISWSGLLRLACWAFLLSVVVALVLPVLGPTFPFGYSPRSREAEVAVEITQLEMGLMTFKETFGRHPPGSLIIPEDGESWRATDRSNIRHMWTQFDFTQPRDLNNDGDTDDVHTLSGAECLVFFLGGVSDSAGRRIGFSKNSRTPFSEFSQNRSGPFYDFNADRLTDVDKDGFPEYGDSLTGAPLLYAATIQGRFRDADLAIFPDGDPRNMQQVYDLRHSQLDFQIISAGDDGKYGVGGEYSDEDFEYTGDRRTEEDNITSFSVYTRNVKATKAHENAPINDRTTRVFFLILWSPMAVLIVLCLASHYLKRSVP